MNLRQILERQEAIRAELKRIEHNPAADSESDGDMVDTLVDEYETLERRRVPLAERAAKLDIIRVASTDDDATEPGDSRPLDVPDQTYRNKRDPFEDLDAVRANVVRPADLKSRALDVIERSDRHGDLAHDYAEQATEMAQRDHGVAKHILLTGSDDYMDAFRAYMADPEANIARAALSLTSANGGYLLPYVLDPTIVLTNTSSANPWRRIAANKRTTSNTWNGVTSAGVNAAWLAEGTEAADNSPTVGNIQITPQKAAAWVFGSYEVLADTNFGEQLPELLQDARDRLEEAAFVSGAGSGGVPKGLLTALGTGTGTNVVSAAATTFAVGDVYATQAALPPRFRNAAGAAWLANLAYINKTRAFDTAGGSSFWANLGQDSPEVLLGRPIYESTTLTSATATGSQVLVFGDFGQFYVVDRVGVSLMYEPMVKGTGASRPTGQAGWFMFWRVGSDVSTTNAFKVLRIT